MRLKFGATFRLTPPWLQVPPYLLHSVRARTSTSNLESKQARKSSSCEVFVHLSPKQKILTCEWKVFYWRCGGFKDWVTTSKLLFQPQEVTRGLQLNFSQSVKSSTSQRVLSSYINFTSFSYFLLLSVSPTLNSHCSIVVHPRIIYACKSTPTSAQIRNKITKQDKVNSADSAFILLII